MRVGIGGFAVGNPAGLGRASRSLILALLQARPDWELHLYLRQESDMERLRLECDEATAGLLERLKVYLPGGMATLLNRVVQEEMDLPARFAGLHLDAYLGLDFTLPGKPVAPREVALIYDVLAYTRPETLSWRARLLYRNAIKRSIQRKARIVVSSRYTQQQLAACFPDEPLDSTVIHLALSPRLWLSAQATAMSDHALQVRGTHAALVDPGRYLLYVGASGKRKNVELLARVYRELVATREYYGALVLAGGDGHLNNVRGSRTDSQPVDLALEAIGAQLPQDNSDDNTERIYDLGFVNDYDLSELYRNADLLVNLSVEEGFGYPVLEALAHGTPAVVTKGSAMAEISSVGVVETSLEPQECAGTLASSLAALQQLRLETRGALEQFNQFGRMGEELAQVIEGK